MSKVSIDKRFQNMSSHIRDLDETKISDLSFDSFLRGLNIWRKDFLDRLKAVEEKVRPSESDLMAARNYVAYRKSIEDLARTFPDKPECNCRMRCIFVNESIDSYNRQVKEMRDNCPKCSKPDKPECKCKGLFVELCPVHPYKIKVNYVSKSDSMPECTCPPDVTECPEHGQRFWVKPETMFKNDKPEYDGPKLEPIPPCDTHCAKCGYWLRPADKSCSFCDPALPPLNVRVAKALGYKAILRQNGEWSMPRTSMEQEFVEYVPRYDSNLTVAIGALEEFVKPRSLFVEIQYHCHQDCYVVKIAGNSTSASSLPLAICEAIVKHSE